MRKKPYCLDFLIDSEQRDNNLLYYIKGKIPLKGFSNSLFSIKLSFSKKYAIVFKFYGY